MISNSDEVRYQTAILAGLGREGRSSYNYFSAHQPDLQWILSDDKPLADQESFWQDLVAQHAARFVPLHSLADLVDELKSSKTVLIKTAGIPRENSGVATCLQAGAVLTSNTAAFFEACPVLTVPPRTIGITGTKGKSTTSSMIYHVLKEAGIPAVLAGNIGVPPLETLSNPIVVEAAAAAPAVVVLELSSHQLRELTVSPHIAVIQDITPEHLDYYTSFDQYLEAKAPIARFQSDQDWVVFNLDFVAPTSVAHRSTARKLCFSLEQKDDAAVYLKDESMWFENQRVLAVSDIPLVGRHNVLNTMPAVAIAMKLFAVPAERVAAAIRSFVGLPHRLEFAGEKNGVSYYNDSQATTPEAAIAALASFPGKEIVLLAGGSDKGVSFDQLGEEIVSRNVTQLLHFPPMGTNIAEAVQAGAQKLPDGVVPQIREVQSMTEAVTAAAASAVPGSVVLLSPACASFGIFKNYQDRGDQFKKCVHELE